MYEARQNKEKVVRCIQTEIKQFILLRRNQNVLQKQRNIQNRLDTIANLTEFINRLRENHKKKSENADKSEIAEHDRLMSSNENHHKNRNVTIQDLINDCQRRINSHECYNDIDYNKINNKKEGMDMVAQLYSSSLADF